MVMCILCFVKHAGLGHVPFDRSKRKRIMAATIDCDFICPLMQKYNDRKAMAGKGNYFNEDEKKKWMGVLKPEIMSSDESC